MRATRGTPQLHNPPQQPTKFEVSLTRLTTLHFTFFAAPLQAPLHIGKHISCGIVGQHESAPRAGSLPAGQKWTHRDLNLVVFWWTSRAYANMPCHANTEFQGPRHKYHRRELNPGLPLGGRTCSPLHHGGSAEVSEGGFGSWLLLSSLTQLNSYPTARVDTSSTTDAALLAN